MAQLSEVVPGVWRAGTRWVSYAAEVEAPVVLPGHGTPYRDGPESTMASARRLGCR